MLHTPLHDSQLSKSPVTSEDNGVSIESTGDEPKIAVVIPCFGVSASILDVLGGIGSEVSNIYVIDDKCPENSGALVKEQVNDPRVNVICRRENGGVGAATMTGFTAAIADGADVIVKIDGDGQMDPRLLHNFVQPILDGQADYTKGNRFFNPDDVTSMPLLRLIGNAGLSFMAKLSTGYWHIFDPTNGYIAIHRKVAMLLPMKKISLRYFFETDLLFRLNTIRAVVMDVPMRALYGDEKSNLKVGSELIRFTFGHMRNFVKRIFYNYFLRNFSIASINLVIGSCLLLFGLIFGVNKWIESELHGITASAGTVMVAALPIIVGVQLILSFLNYDVDHTPRTVLHNRL